jgi:hypothetical protein
MSATCTFTGCAGYTTVDGKPAHRMLEAGQVFEDTAQVVVSRPDLFDVDPPKRGPGRPPAPKPRTDG